MTEEKREFVLVHTIKDVAKLKKESSPVKEYYELKWHISISRESDNLGIYLHCNCPIKSNLWAVEVSFPIKLMPPDGEELFRKTVIGRFDHYETNWGYSPYAKWDDVTGKYATDNELTLKVNVEVKKMIGIVSPNQLNFHEPVELMSDVCIKVENSKFNVTKAILAQSSPVFKAMFFGKFNEAKSKEVVVEDVTAECFSVFLAIIYSRKPQLTSSNVEDLMKLADRYDVQRVTGKCQKFLLTNNDLKMEKKMEMAEKYTLPLLQEQVLDSMESLEEIRDLRDNMKEIQINNLKALLDKSLTFA